MLVIQTDSSNLLFCVTFMKYAAPRQNAEFQISPRISRIRRNLVLRSNSLLITIYGDAIAPREQAVWLGSLINLASLFDLSPRLVRTSAARLTADGWFDVERVGRRSYYGLSEQGLQRVRHADRRIYEFDQAAWDGRWTLALLDGTMRASVRQHLKRELLWEGFGQLAPGVFAHPRVDQDVLLEILEATGTRKLVAILCADGTSGHSSHPIRSIMHETFRLASVDEAWTQFIARFEPALSELPGLSEAAAFFVRTLLIHEYRRVLLRDPDLPEALLASDWPGRRARQLCRELYAALLGPSEQFLQANAEILGGRLSRTPRAVARRVGAI